MEIFDSELYLFYVFFWGGILVFLWDIGVHVKALRDHFCPKDPKDEEKKENAKKKNSSPRRGPVTTPMVNWSVNFPPLPSGLVK